MAWTLMVIEMDEKSSERPKGTVKDATMLVRRMVTATDSSKAKPMVFGSLESTADSTAQQLVDTQTLS